MAKAETIYICLTRYIYSTYTASNASLFLKFTAKKHNAAIKYCFKFTQCINITSAQNDTESRPSKPKTQLVHLQCWSLSVTALSTDVRMRKRRWRSDSQLLTRIYIVLIILHVCTWALISRLHVIADLNTLQVYCTPGEKPRLSHYI